MNNNAFIIIKLLFTHTSHSCIQLRVITVMNIYVKDECLSTEVYLTPMRCVN